jgi:hypothetical protein
MDSQTKSSQVANASRSDYEKAIILSILKETKKNQIPVIFRNDIVERFRYLGLPNPYDSSLKWAESQSDIILKRVKVKGSIKYIINIECNINDKQKHSL